MSDVCQHVPDNQGFCHRCGMPMNIDGWYAYVGYSDKATEEWNAMVAKWDAEHSTR